MALGATILWLEPDRCALSPVALRAGAHNVPICVATAFADGNNVVKLEALLEGRAAPVAFSALLLVEAKNIIVGKASPVASASARMGSSLNEPDPPRMLLGVPCSLLRNFGLLRNVACSCCNVSALLTGGRSAGFLVGLLVKAFKRQKIFAGRAKLPTLGLKRKLSEGQWILDSPVHVPHILGAGLAAPLEPVFQSAVATKRTTGLDGAATTTPFARDRIRHVGPPSQALPPLGVSSTARGYSYFTTSRTVLNG